MKLCNEPFFNRRNWILEHLEDLELTLEQAFCVFCIDYFNEFRYVVDVPSLANKMKMDDGKVDLMLNDLMEKGYLQIDFVDRRIYYNIDGVFKLKEDAKPCDSNEYQTLFALYESEFARPLSQKESEMLSEWISTYELKLIEYALREAVIYDKKSFAYINRILINWKESKFTAKMYEEKIMRDTNVILDEMHHMFPDAKCALHHRNAYELIIAVVLSAQTTDEAVNKVTPALFERFPTPYDLAKAEESEIASYIKTIGLYRNKSKSIKNLAKSLVENFNGEVPSSMKDLTSLAGVGRKTANVVQSVWFGIPAFAVDTHVERISKRLGLAKFDDSVENVEKKLKRKIDRNRWNDGHHLFIFFGRYHCTARNPKCDNCPFTDICRNDKFQQYKEKNKKK